MTLCGHRARFHLGLDTPVVPTGKTTWQYVGVSETLPIVSQIHSELVIIE
jgi:hypothetical protein